MVSNEGGAEGAQRGRREGADVRLKRVTYIKNRNLKQNKTQHKIKRNKITEQHRK
jgi:hypothetical protein